MRLTDNQVKELAHQAFHKIYADSGDVVAALTASRRMLVEAGIRAAIKFLNQGSPEEYYAAETLELALKRGDL
jgi:hypothetical protein